MQRSGTQSTSFLALNMSDEISICEQLRLIKNSGEKFEYEYGPDPFPCHTPSSMHGNTSKHMFCRVCYSREGVKKNHRHHSTQAFHEILKNGFTQIVNCPTCKVVHRVKRDCVRELVLVTSSTLHNVHLNPAVRLPFHIDIESICGGKISELHQAWVHAYSNATRAIDTIVVCGLNDVRNCTPEEFMEKVTKWRDDVKKQNPLNTFRMAELLRPPMFAWFPKDGKPPSNDYVNYLDRIDQINSKIKTFNEEEGAKSMVGFSNEGCRSVKCRQPDGSKANEKQHIFKDWRECGQGKQACLHLNETRRAGMLLKLVRYIIHNFF